ADEFAHHGREAVGHALTVAIFVIDALAFDVAELPQGLAEAMPHRRVVNDPDTRYTRRLLRPRCQRPHRCAAEQRDEIAAPHSITSSACRRQRYFTIARSAPRKASTDAVGFPKRYRYRGRWKG